MRRIVVGTGTAVALAFSVAVPSMYGISTWKYVLAAIGLMLFVLAARDASTRT